MGRDDGGSEKIDGGFLRSQPGSANEHTGFLVERSGKIENGGSSGEGLPPMAEGHVFRSAKESEVGVVEGAGADGLNKGDLVADLVQLPLDVFFVEKGKAGAGKRRVGENVFQLAAQQARGSSDG